MVASLVVAAAAQVSSATPAKYIKATRIYFTYFSSLHLQNNTQEIRQELLDTNLIQLIATVNGLNKSDLMTVQILPGDTKDFVKLYQIREPSNAFNTLEKQLWNYVSERQSGHTRQFLFSAITNHLQPSRIADSDLMVIWTNQPWLPVTKLKKEESFTYTNVAGQITSISSSLTIGNGKSQLVVITNMPKVDVVMRRQGYSVVDGNIGWRYSFDFTQDGQIERSDYSRCDPVDLDPQYALLLRGIDKEIDAEMSKKGVRGLGSVHTYWSLKKQKLKAKGIEWRSPSELNPETIYD